jgi:hypothetical protein
MKARVLKHLLGDTGYTVGDYGDYIAVGSSLVHNLIKVDKKTFAITYALDWQHQGRASICHDELTKIWDKLEELIATHQIDDIIAGRDEIESPIMVYYAKDGEIFETVTDKLGWPNTTIDGVVMHNDEYFVNKDDAIASEVVGLHSEIKYASESLVEARENLRHKQDVLNEYATQFDRLTKEYCTVTEHGHVYVGDRLVLPKTRDKSKI